MDRMTAIAALLGAAGPIPPTVHTTEKHAPIGKGRVVGWDNVKPSNKVGRNDPCPCESGKKFKKCCLNKPKKAEVSNEDMGSHSDG